VEYGGKGGYDYVGGLESMWIIRLDVGKVLRCESNVWEKLLRLFAIRDDWMDIRRIEGFLRSYEENVTSSWKKRTKWEMYGKS
jgi:hypothetical protein